MAKHINVIQESLFDYMPVANIEKLPENDKTNYLRLAYKENQLLRAKIKELEAYIISELGYRYPNVGRVTEKHNL